MTDRNAHLKTALGLALAGLTLAGFTLAGCQSTESPTAGDPDPEPDLVYRIRSLVGPSVQNSTARAVNDSGEVVGSFGGLATAWTVDADGDASGPEVLLLPSGDPAVSSEALAINTGGQIVGKMGSGATSPGQGPTLPFVWTAGSGIVELPLPDGLDSGVAYDINDAGQITGGGAPGDECEWSTGGRVLVWTVDPTGEVVEVRDLGSLGGAGAIGHGITALGDVVGVLWEAGDQEPQSFLWSEHAVQILPAGGEALAVNDDGTVAGEWSGRAGVWSTAGLQVIGPLGSVAHGLNNDGVVVGEVLSGLDGERGLGFVFEDGTSSPLEALSGIDGSRSRGINAHGVVVGESYIPALGITEAVIWIRN